MLTEQQEKQILEAIFANRKIEAIKLYRMATGEGLKESKEFVEELAAKLYADSPERFARKPGVGCAAAIMLAIGVGVVVVVLP